MYFDHICPLLPTLLFCVSKNYIHFATKMSSFMRCKAMSYCPLKVTMKNQGTVLPKFTLGSQ